ncbi:MAG: hypothetical protein ABIH76_07555 [Candidatus Bathyarchaeota archaeon]
MTIALIDWAIFIAIIGVMFTLGVLGWSRSRTYDQYLVAERKVGYFQTICVSAGLATAAALGVTALGYEFGMVGSWFFIMLGIGFFILAFTITTRLRQLAKFQVVDVFELRYGIASSHIMAVITLIAYITLLSTGYVGAGLVITVLTGLPLLTSIMIIGVVFIVKVAVGGWRGTSYTTTFQLLIFLVGLTIVALTALTNVGGWEGLTVRVPADALDIIAMPLAPLLIFAFFFVMALSMPATADAYQAINAAKSPLVAKISIFIAGIIVIIVGIVSALIGVAGMAVFPYGTLESGELVMPLFVLFLPPGLLGLAAGALLAGASSLVDLDQMVGATLIARSFVKKEVNTKILRILTLVVGAVALILALAIPSIIGLIELCFRIYIPAAVPAIIAAFYWKRATAPAAIASVITGAIMGGLWTFLVLPALHFTVWEFILEPTFIGLIASSTVLIVGTYLSKPPPTTMVKAMGFS